MRPGEAADYGSPDDPQAPSGLYDSEPPNMLSHKFTPATT